MEHFLPSCSHVYDGAVCSRGLWEETPLMTTSLTTKGPSIYTMYRSTDAHRGRPTLQHFTHFPPKTVPKEGGGEVSGPRKGEGSMRVGGKHETNYIAKKGFINKYYTANKRFQQFVSFLEKTFVKKKLNYPNWFPIRGAGGIFGPLIWWERLGKISVHFIMKKTRAQGFTATITSK